MRYSFNAYAYDGRGWGIPERGFGDMKQYGDFNAKAEDDADALAEAREWARKTFAREPRCATVGITLYGQERSEPWHRIRFVETIERPAQD